jgi:hypothetical protein
MQPRSGQRVVIKNLALDDILSILASEPASGVPLARAKPHERAPAADRQLS